MYSGLSQNSFDFESSLNELRIIRVKFEHKVSSVRSFNNPTSHSPNGQPRPDGKYVWRDDRLWYRGRLLVSACEELRQLLLQEFNSSPQALRAPSNIPED